MARVKFLKIKPIKFFERIQAKTDLSFQKLADTCKVHRRSFSDWKHGKYLMPLAVFKKLIKISSLSPPVVIVLTDYWHVKEAGRKGAIARNALYGSPGTPEGRSKGGKTTCRKFHSDPELAKKIGFLLRKQIYYPKKSSRLAELIGILIGDGGINDYQVTVTLNKETDRDYAYFVIKLFKDLFHINSTIGEREGQNTYEITVSSRNLIEYLMKLGLKKGNKVKQQIDVPDWIKRNKILATNCLRGLFDTDGCFYIDKHRYKGKVYHNCAMCFRNRSIPLLLFFKTQLEQLGFHPTRNTEFSITLRREDEIVTYFREIGSNNSKHTLKFNRFFKTHKKQKHSDG